MKDLRNTIALGTNSGYRDLPQRSHRNYRKMECLATGPTGHMRSRRPSHWGQHLLESIRKGFRHCLGRGMRIVDHRWRLCLSLQNFRYYATTGATLLSRKRASSARKDKQCERVSQKNAREAH